MNSRCESLFNNEKKRENKRPNDYHQTDKSFPSIGKQIKNIKKRRAVKGNAKKLHGSCHAETVAIFLQSPCRIQGRNSICLRHRIFLIP